MYSPAARHLTLLSHSSFKETSVGNTVALFQMNIDENRFLCWRTSMCTHHRYV